MGLFRFKYGRFNIDEFMAWQSDMFELGFSVDASPGEYGRAECLNCRCTVRLGIPEMTSHVYAKQHRQVCGDRFLLGVVRDGLPAKLARIADSWGGGQFVAGSR